ncbi:hypothetical protein Tco_1388759 [Tanacetum coccineum]
MQGSKISQQERHSKLMNEFDKFVAVKGESLTSVYEKFSTLINVMDWNDFLPQDISINIKILNSLQPEWRRYVNSSKAKKAARNHDPLVLVANSHTHSLNSHASSSYSRSPQPYYINHPSPVIDNDDDYQGEIQGDAQEYKLTTTMMLLARAITRRYSTPTNNRLRTSSNTTNQSVIQDGRVDIESKNVGYAGNGNRNAGRQNRNQATNAGNGLVHSIEEYDQNVQRNPRTELTTGKTNMLLATKDEARMHLDEEENDFMLENAYEDNILEELNAAVNASQVDMINRLLSKNDHEQHHPEKLETIIHTSADDQIDSDIIFDNPYVDNNSGQAEHDTNAHDQSLHDFESLIINVKVEAEKQKMNIELKKQQTLLQWELETCKERKKDLKERENKYVEDIVSLEEKLQSHVRIVYKMSLLLQTIYMLGKKPNKFYDPHLKTGLGYEHPERLKKAIEA